MLHDTGGTKGARSLRSARSFQLKFFIHWCDFTSPGPFTPSLSMGFRFRSYRYREEDGTLLMKLAAAGDQPKGSSSSLSCTCRDNIWSRISRRLAPRYGLYFRVAFSEYLAHHALECYNANSEVVYGDPVVAPAHDLRRYSVANLQTYPCSLECRWCHLRCQDARCGRCRSR